MRSLLLNSRKSFQAELLRGRWVNGRQVRWIGGRRLGYAAEIREIDREARPATGRVVSPDGKQVIFVMSLAPAADGKTIVKQMAVPLGIALKAGVKIDVDGAYSTTLPVSRCTTQGCLVEGPVEGALIETMRTKPVVTITVATPDGKTVPIKLSLDGFADAFATMTGTQAGGKAAQTK